MGLFGCCMENSVDRARGRHWLLAQMLWRGQEVGTGQQPLSQRHGKDGAESGGQEEGTWGAREIWLGRGLEMREAGRLCGAWERVGRL